MFKKIRKNLKKSYNRLRSKNRGVNNEIFVDKKVNIRYSVVGSNNKLYVESPQNPFPCNVTVKIIGDNNTVIIKKPEQIQKLKIFIGNSLPINNCYILIDENVSIVDVEVFGFSQDSKLIIGKDCLFSKNIQIRMGEVPHFIFDKITCEYLDKGSNVSIGEHCWIGENVGIMKNASIPANNIVGFNSVVTKKFDKMYTVIAGNPAQVKKENIDWQKDISALQTNSHYFESYNNYIKGI